MQEKSKRGSAVFGSLKCLVLSSLFCALSIIFGKYLAIPIGTVMRFSLENLPILLASFSFGPIVGAMCGGVADLIGCMLVGYEINPLVTVGAMLIGAVGGIAYKLIKTSSFLKTVISVLLAHLLGSVIVKTVGLAKFYEIDLYLLMLWRLVNYIVVGALEIFALYYLFKSKSFCAQLEKIRADVSVIGRKRGNRE